MVFQNPPAAAWPPVLWMWMGGNVSSQGIPRDLEAWRDAGFGGATMFSLADACPSWAGVISNCPTPEVVTFTTWNYFNNIRRCFRPDYSFR